MVKPSWKLNLTNAFPIPDDKNGLNGDIYKYDGDFERKGTFAFLSLPRELRNRIYHLTWYGHSKDDIHYVSRRPPLSASDRGRLNLTLISTFIHAESTHFLYSTTSFRIFPLQDFQSLPTPLTLPPHYRSHITSLSLMVGSSWTNPPANWRMGKALIRCFGRMKLVRVLKIFVEVDPSVPLFARYRKSETFYTDWCGNLVKDVLKALVSTCETIELDGNSGVDPGGQLSNRIVQEVERSGRRLRWGPEWTTKVNATAAGKTITLTSGTGLGEVAALADGLKVMEIEA